ncbi:MAG: nitroreductase family deazaflavin-dependent oxidoreductase [Mycobacteriales bacterium]
MTNEAGTRGRSFPSAARQMQKLATALHRTVYAASGGRLGASIGGNQVVVLVTTGRRSGATRRTPLFAYKDDADYLVVASNGGTAKHPDWYLNLTAVPDAKIQLGQRSWPVRASVLDHDEKARWWPTVVEHYKGYAAYQQATDRDIPMVRLSPR